MRLLGKGKGVNDKNRELAAELRGIKDAAKAEKTKDAEESGKFEHLDSRRGGKGIEGNDSSRSVKDALEIDGMTPEAIAENAAKPWVQD